MILRPACPADSGAITAIYAEQVLHETATAEEAPPDEGEMLARMEAVEKAGLPWVVAEVGGEVVGYAYARPYHARAAYRWTVEDAVYVAAGARGQGIGRALLGELLTECERRGRRQMVASVTVQGGEASIALHLGAGFRETGRLLAIIYKFGRWLDVAYFQRALGEGGGPVVR